MHRLIRGILWQISIPESMILTMAKFRSVLEFTLNLPAKALRRLTLAKSRNIVTDLRTFALLLVTKHHV